MADDTISNSRNERSGYYENESESYQRPRTEYIMFSFEKSLGNFVRKQPGDVIGRIPPKTKEQIAAESQRPDEFNDTIEWLVENSYISTLLDLSVDASEDADLINAAVELRGFCEQVGIFAIRNVIAHPNRRWIAHYWHVACALATHPTIVQLGLKEVVESLAAAESGGFEAPPDSWRVRIAEMEIPNNLSDAMRPTEHDTFVGRKKERSELKKRILKRGRMASHSIVAAGGLGKTALLLSCLQDIVKDHQARLQFDQVVFLSSKSKLLTADGEVGVRADIDETQPISDQLSRQILGDASGTWEQLVEIHGENRLLLCLDNVESILSSESPGPRDQLEQLLMDDFPSKWTIVVTSRIPVNHTSELQLGEMTAEDKRMLAHRYSSTIGFSGVSKELEERIADRARSPLAVRIWIDFLRMGHEADEALARTNELTTKFAYENLINALEKNVRDLIEALLVIEVPIGVPQLARLLQWSVSSVKDAVVVAKQRFLVHGDGAGIGLHEALREHLLVRGPLDAAYRRFRNGIQTQWDSFRSEEQLIGQVRPSDIADADPARNFDDVDDGDLKKELYKISLQMSSNSFSANDALRRLSNLEDGVAAVHRVIAMVYRKMADFVSSRQHLQLALSVDAADWRAAMLLAHSYRRSGLYEQAIDCTKSFIIRGEESPAERPPTYSRLAFIHYTSRLWRASDQMAKGVFVADAKQEIEGVITETARWQAMDLDDYAETLAGIHAMALRRSVEHSHTASRDRAYALCKALSVYRELFESGRTVSGGTALELQALLEQFQYLYNSPDGDEYLDKVKGAVSLVLENIDTLLEAPADQAKELRNVLVRFRRVRGGEAVRDVSDEMWQKLGDGDSEEYAGGVVAKIYHIPYNMRCVFAEDEERTQYYVRASIVNPRSEFDRLAEGMQILVWPDDRVESSYSAVAASRAEVVGIAEGSFPELPSDESADVAMVTAEIYFKPPGRSHLFARDEEGNEYYVRASNVRSGIQFDELAEGMTLQVRPTPVGPDHPHRAVPVSEAVYIGDKGRQAT